MTPSNPPSFSLTLCATKARSERERKSREKVEWMVEEEGGRDGSKDKDFNKG